MTKKTKRQESVFAEMTTKYTKNGPYIVKKYTNHAGIVERAASTAGRGREKGNGKTRSVRFFPENGAKQRKFTEKSAGNPGKRLKDEIFYYIINTIM